MVGDWALYWMRWANGQSEIWRTDRYGGPPTRLATSEFGRNLTHDTQYVYWTTTGRSFGKFINPYTRAPYKDDGRVLRAPKAGGDVDVIATRQRFPSHVALTDTHVTWHNRVGGGVGAVPHDGQIMSIVRP